MITLYRKKFLKELATIPQKTRVQITQFAFEECPQLTSIEKAHKIEKMKGFPDYYKIRFGDYRVGVKYENNTLIFERVLHRRDIYKYFP